MDSVETDARRVGDWDRVRDREGEMSELVLEAKRTAVVVIDLQKGIVGVEGDPHSTATVIANACGC